MKKLILVLLSCFVMAELSAQAPILIDSKVSDVTVFTNYAQVTQKGKVKLNRGENILQVVGITNDMDKNSVQVQGSDKYMILSVKCQTNYTTNAKQSAVFNAKKDSLEDLQFTISMRQSLERVYLEEKNLLLANKNIKGEQSVLLVEDVEEMAEYFRSHLTEIEYKLLEINQEKRRINREINRLNLEISQMNASINGISNDIYINVNCPAAGTFDIEFSYLTYAASWYPIYDIRTEDIDKSMELRYNAQVSQATGQDWENVNLTLSTGNPSVGGQAPSMNPWYLYFYSEQTMYKKKLRNDKRREDSYEPAAGNVNNDLKEVYITAGLVSDGVEISETPINVEFKINIPYDIPSDNQAYEVEIQRSNVDADYNYKAIPKLDKSAFLTANITSWTDLNLLPGTSQIYFKGTYVGEAFIDPIVTEDTLQISMGRDPSIAIERELVSNMCKNQTLGLKKKSSKAFKITIKNTKTKAIQVDLYDQIPLSSFGDIEVTADNLSGGTLNEETGEVKWEVNLAAGESKTFMIEYSAKYPRNKKLSNL